MAFNQGFYNLFLAVIALAGVFALHTQQRPVGAALVIAGTASMLAAAALLFATSADKRGAALKQGTLPLLTLVALVIGL